jgi:hypothetical protein
MNFIHSREYLSQGDAAELNCDTQCNFMLTDDSNFSSYKTGERFTYYGGHYKMFPARIAAPHTGYWNITIDLAGGVGNIRYDLRVIKRS